MMKTKTSIVARLIGAAGFPSITLPAFGKPVIYTPPLADELKRQVEGSSK